MTHDAKWCCDDCGEVMLESEVLKALSPFDSGQMLWGCRNCKVVGDMTELCDEPGCELEAHCGWPSPDGYRRTCGAHFKGKRI